MLPKYPLNDRKKTASLQSVAFKKRHTLKAQVVLEQDTGRIVCTAIGLGRVHDFRLFKNSRLPLLPSQLVLADKGYQGLVKLHQNSCTPTKKPRQTQTLSQAKRQHNSLLSQSESTRRTHQPTT